jgi:hypothetical protein
VKRKNKLTIELPPEFIELCRVDGVEPEVVLKGFIADPSDIANNPRIDDFASNGSDERSMAQDYYIVLVIPGAKARGDTAKMKTQSK